MGENGMYAKPCTGTKHKNKIVQCSKSKKDVFLTSCEVVLHYLTSHLECYNLILTYLHLPSYSILRFSGPVSHYPHKDN